MRILIIEDEEYAARRLEKMIVKRLPDCEIVGVLDAVEESIEWFKENKNPHLLFLDIHLSDGKSFSLLEKVDIKCPIIFTTAYDQYALKAFDFNSIDYLLKPVEEVALDRAIGKWKSIHASKGGLVSFYQQNIQDLLSQLKGNFKKRFLVKVGDQYLYVPTEEVAFFKSEDGETYLYTVDGKRFIISQKLDVVLQQIDPQNFFRINRKFIVAVAAMGKISTWFSGRLKLELDPSPEEEVIVSRDRVADFRAWLDQ